MSAQDGAEPNSIPCAECGHVWFTGERSHRWAEEPVAGQPRSRVLCALCADQLELDASGRESAGPRSLPAWSERER
jgi:hypothetical protein